MADIKSSEQDLKKRGYVTKDQIREYAGARVSILLTMLHGTNPCERTIAAYNLSALDNQVVDELLKQLAKEKCLYTKIAICETLERGDQSTAARMILYLGTIGQNQYIKLPDKVSAKKSYPLPRDIVARSLGKMDSSIFKTLLNVLETQDIIKIREVLDAIGFMAFYHKELSSEVNQNIIYSTMQRYHQDDIIVWKCILCLSAFPSDETKNILEEYAKQKNGLTADHIFVKEAKRSLQLVQLALH